MPKWGMVIDLDRCTACGACMTACKSENNIPVVGPDESEKGRTISWMELIPDEKDEGVLMPRTCLHCDEPPCTKVCPVYATYSTPEGIVAQNFGRCIGCRFCMAACPYGAKFFNWEEYRANGTLSFHENPDVSTRPTGVVEKCTLCHHRLQLARERARTKGRAFRAQDYVPACVETCPAEAMVFGDLSDPNSVVSQLHRSPRVRSLLPELGTKPKIVFLAKEGSHEFP